MQFFEISKSTSFPKFRFVKFAPLALMLLSATSLPSSAAEFPDYNFVHTTGEAYIYVMPDTGEVDFDIKIQETNIEKATSKINERIATLQSFSAQQSSINLSVGDVKRDITTLGAATDAVQLKCTVRINADNLEKWKDLLTIVLSMPDVDKLSVFFDVKNRDEIDDQLLIEASRKAKKRAELIAQSFGRHISSASAITDGQLRNLSSSIGLVTSNASTNRTKNLTEASDYLTAVAALRFAKSLDVVYRTK